MRPSIRPLGWFKGAVAQLIERVVRNDEVVGLIPICSTILRQREALVKDALPSFSDGGAVMTAVVWGFGWQASRPASEDQGCPP